MQTLQVIQYKHVNISFIVNNEHLLFAAMTNVILTS